MSKNNNLILQQAELLYNAKVINTGAYLRIEISKRKSGRGDPFHFR